MSVKTSMTRPNHSQAMQARYQRAKTIQAGYMNSSLVKNDTLYPHWIGETNYFWYERVITISDSPALIGKEYRLVNATTASNDIAFDHAEFANALAAVSGQNIQCDNLPISLVDIQLSLDAIDTGLSTTIMQLLSFHLLIQEDHIVHILQMLDVFLLVIPSQGLTL